MNKQLELLDKMDNDLRTAMADIEKATTGLEQEEYSTALRKSIRALNGTLKILNNMIAFNRNNEFRNVLGE